MKKYNPAKWQLIRAKGRTQFVFIHGVLLFGLPMLIFMSFITKPFVNGFFSPTALIHYVAWLFAGLIFGIYLWFLAERQFKRACDEQ